MLSPIEAQNLARGQTLKRYVRAAAALNDLYDDTALGKAARVGRNAVRAWWRGAQMAPATLRRVARVTGLAALVRLGAQEMVLENTAPSRSRSSIQVSAGES